MDIDSLLTSQNPDDLRALALKLLPSWPNSRLNELLPYAENSFA